MREEDIRPKALLDQFFRRLRSDAQRLAARSESFVEVSCPFCAHERSRTAFVKEGFGYCLCESCESLFVSPRPTSEALAQYADGSEAVAFWSTHFYRETAQARREQIFRPRARLIAELVEKHSDGRARAFADIGAGYGLFLQELSALEVFPEVIAVEPDRRLAAICRAAGFRVIENRIEEVASGDIAADFAAAFEVLEHVFDPAAFLFSCSRIIRPGGLLLFTTLTISGFDLQVLWEYSRSISPPQHLNFPSVPGIYRLIERAGLEAVSVATPGQLDVDIVRNMLKANPDLPVPRFARAVATADDETRDDFQRFLKSHRLSSHLQCLVRRRQ